MSPSDVMMKMMITAPHDPKKTKNSNQTSLYHCDLQSVMLTMRQKNKAK